MCAVCFTSVQIIPVAAAAARAWYVKRRSTSGCEGPEVARHEEPEQRDGDRPYLLALERVDEGLRIPVGVGAGAGDP